MQNHDITLIRESELKSFGSNPPYQDARIANSAPCHHAFYSCIFTIAHPKNANIVLKCPFCSFAGRPLDMHKLHASQELERHSRNRST